jgi:Helix-turn-helix domain
MRARYLSALEEDRFDDLPGRTYARAFLRTYAHALGLQADQFVAAFDEQVPEPSEESEPALRGSRRRPTVVSWRMAPLAAGLTLVGLLVWSAWSNDHVQHSVAPPPAPVAAASGPHSGGVRAVVAKLPPRPAAVVVRATSGPCWVQARRGGASGPVLAERTLEPGEVLRLTAPHVWLRLGAPWNVDVRRGSHVERLKPTGLPVNVLL